MNLESIIISCCIDLYNASEDKTGNPGNFRTLYAQYGERLPYNAYYINESKLINIIKEYLENVSEDKRKEFIRKVELLAPNSSYNGWKK